MGFPTNLKAQTSPSYYASNSSNHFLKGWLWPYKEGYCRQHCERGGGLEVEEVGWGKGKDFFGKPN